LTRHIFERGPAYFWDKQKQPKTFGYFETVLIRIENMILNDNTILFLFTIIEIHNKRFRIDSRQNRPRVGGDGQTTNKVILRFGKGKNFEE